MVIKNSVVSVSDSNVPQQVKKDNTIEFVKVLSQFPTYTYKGTNGWMLVKDICDKSGYSHSTKFTNLVSDNKDEVVVLEGEELKRFCDEQMFITNAKTRSVTIIGPNAFIEAVNRSTIQYFRSVREQSKDVLLRYIKGEEVSIANDLNVQPKESKKWLLDAIGKVFAEDTMYYKRAVAVIANEECPMMNLPLPTIETEEFVLSADEVAKKLIAKGFKFKQKTWNVNKNNIGKLRKEDGEIAKLSKEFVTEGTHKNHLGIETPNKQIKYSVKVVDYIFNNY